MLLLQWLTYCYTNSVYIRKELLTLMKKSDFIIQIVFNYILAAVFIWFAIDYVDEFGWGFFSIISVLFATRDIVKGTRILQIYLKIKKGNKP